MAKKVKVCCVDGDCLKFYKEHNMDIFDDAIVEDDGAIRWDTNGNYLMSDTMQRIINNGFSDFSVEATTRKRAIQVEEQLAKIRQYQIKFTDEEKAELDANNPKGTRIVNVITGETYITK